MANCARSAPSRAPSTENDVSTVPRPTRRGLLAIAAGAAAVASSPIAAGASPLSRRWDRLRAQFEAAREAMQSYEDHIYRPASDRVAALSGKAPPAFVEIETPFRPTPDRVWVHDSPPNHPVYEPARIARAEYDAWRERFNEAWRLTNFEPIDQRMTELDFAECTARTRLMNVPAPDLAALAYKLKLALEPVETIEGEREALARDVARLSA